VRNLADRLLDQQTLVRQREVDAPSADFARQAVKVAIGIEPE
jgi:hypothetical protein